MIGESVAALISFRPIGLFCERQVGYPFMIISGTFELAQQEVAQLISVYDGKVSPEKLSGLVLDFRYPS